MKQLSLFGEIIVDNFAGGGGASTGIELATGRSVDIAINQLHVHRLHFAWDNPRDRAVPAALRMFREHSNIVDHRKLAVYVLTNYWSDLEDDLRRVYWLRDNGYDPYVMIYDKVHAPKKIKHLQRWVNNKIVFGACEFFEDYDSRRA